MSRFSNLEFDNDGDGLTEREPLPVKNEAYYLAQAQGAFENGDFEQALRLYGKAIGFGPHNPSPWAGQARMLIELNHYDEAIQWADKALEKFPDFPELLAAKAVALSRDGRSQEALACSDAAIHQEAKTPYVWMARGDVLLARKEPRADYCFDKALALTPNDWFTVWQAARIRSSHKQFAAALKLLQRAVELNAGHFLLWLEMGNCQEALGLVSAARRSFSQARQLNPQCRPATLGLTRAAQVGILGRARGWLRGLTSG